MWTGSNLKQPLKSSPFLKKFEYGNGESDEGYWNYDHLAVQLEDCCDVLEILYPDYAYMFQFDHSCGHDRMLEDGLRVNRLTRSYGGAQPKMHDTEIKHQGFLGSFSKSVTSNACNSPKQILDLWP